MSKWPTEDLAAIASAEELQVITRRADHTPARPVTIWVVRVDDDL